MPAHNSVTCFLMHTNSGMRLTSLIARVLLVLVHPAQPAQASQRFKICLHSPVVNVIVVVSDSWSMSKSTSTVRRINFPSVFY